MWWLKTMAEQDGEELDRIGNGRGAKRSEATEARISAEMVLVALRYQFPAMDGLNDHELRRRVLSKIDGGQDGT